MKVYLAYWPSQWQAATDEETVINMVFGVFSSMEKAREVVQSSLEAAEWEEFGEEIRYEAMELDRAHSIPHV